MYDCKWSQNMTNAGMKIIDTNAKKRKQNETKLSWKKDKDKNDVQHVKHLSISNVQHRFFRHGASAESYHTKGIFIKKKKYTDIMHSHQLDSSTNKH